MEGAKGPNPSHGEDNIKQKQSKCGIWRDRVMKSKDGRCFSKSGVDLLIITISKAIIITTKIDLILFRH